MSRDRRRGEVFLKVGEPRFRAPAGVEEVVVGFGPAPLQEVFFRSFGTKKLILKGVILEPASVAGRHVAAFYRAPADGTLGAGSRLRADITAMLGDQPREGDLLEVGKVFANAKAHVRLRRVGTGAGAYDVIGQIIRRAL